MCLIGGGDKEGPILAIGPFARRQAQMSLYEGKKSSLAGYVQANLSHSSANPGPSKQVGAKSLLQTLIPLGVELIQQPAPTSI